MNSTNIITIDDLPRDPVERFLCLKADPWAFMCTCVFSSDPKDEATPIKRAPVHKAYVRRLVADWEANSFTALVKSRQMWCSWLYVALNLWLTISGAERQVFFVTDVQEKADKELLKRAEFIFDNIPHEAWHRELLPSKRRIENHLYFENISSGIHALPSGEHKSRGYVASSYLLDEFAFWDNAAETLAAIRPSTARLNIVSTIPEQKLEARPYFYDVCYDRDGF